MLKLAATVVATAALAAPAMAGPVFILNNTGGLEEGTLARAGLEAATMIWASKFTDNVTVRIDVGFRTLAKGVLGQAGSMAGVLDYGTVKGALAADAKSGFDQSAVASLDPTLTFLTNEAGNCTTRVGCVAADINTRVLDNDNTRDNNFLTVTNANRKALGLLSDNGGTDSVITFSSAYKWDFDPTDGITKGFYDFVGVAVHEIGHALGFISGVDLADTYMTYNYPGLDSTHWGYTLDLFRYTGTDRDWTVGGAPCTSADGGKSCIGLMATGRNGDKRQASHWKDNKGIGIMDPTASAGRVLRLTWQDEAALDIIGWDTVLGEERPGGTGGTSGLGSTGRLVWTEGYSFMGDGFWVGEEIRAVPQPGALLLFGLGAALLTAARRRS